MSVVEIHLDSGISLISYHGVVVPYDSHLWESPDTLHEKLIEAKRLMPYCDDVARLDTVLSQYDRHRELKESHLEDYETCLRRAYMNPFLEAEQKELAAEIVEKVEAVQLQRGRSRRMPKSLRDAVFARDGGVCRYCGDSPDKPHLDHVIPFSYGGKTELSNLVLSCRPCNYRKGAKTPEEAGMTLAAL